VVSLTRRKCLQRLLPVDVGVPLDVAAARDVRHQEVRVVIVDVERSKVDHPRRGVRSYGSASSSVTSRFTSPRDSFKIVLIRCDDSKVFHPATASSFMGSLLTSSRKRSRTLPSDDLNNAHLRGALPGTTVPTQPAKPVDPDEVILEGLRPR
jgi:hypothetical protein